MIFSLSVPPDLLSETHLFVVFYAFAFVWVFPGLLVGFLSSVQAEHRDVFRYVIQRRV